MMHTMQQLAFYYPDQEDQEISNLIYRSNFTCLVPFSSTAEITCNDTRRMSVQFKDPKVFVSGHNYCIQHGKWEKLNVVPKMIHMNGSSNKDQCAKNSKNWGYEMPDKCD